MVDGASASGAFIAQKSDDSGEPRSRVVAGVLRARIRAGKYAPGERLYSIRELMTEFRVAKNTIVAAYAELERDGLVVSRRTGHFVTDDFARIASSGSIDDLIADCRRRLEARGFSDADIRAAFFKAGSIS